MATASLGRLTLDLVAQVGQFVDPLSKAERKAKESSDNMKKSFKSFGDQIKDSLGGTQLGSAIDGISGKLGALRGGFLTAGAAAAGMTVGGIAIATGALAKMAIESAKADATMAMLASRANINTTNFQIMTHAAAQLGVSQEQLGSIFADVQEKFGEFTATAGGGAKDFFDALKNNTKMTDKQIQEFGKTLQGKDGVEAVQMLKNKLDDLGASSQEQRFVFESLASDLGNLLPLFNNGGELIERYGTALEEAGVIKSKEAIEQSRLLAAQTQSVQTRFDGFKTQLSSQVTPVLNTLLSGFLDGAENGKQFGTIIQAVGVIAKGVAMAVVGLAAGITNVITLIKGFVQQAQNIGATALNVWNADGIKAKTTALATGLKTAWNTTGDTISSIVDNTKQTIHQMSNIMDSSMPKLDKLGQLYYDTGKAAENSAKGLKTNTKEADENAKASEKAAKALKTHAKEQENLNKMVGASALSGLRIKSSEAFAGGNVRAYTANFAQMTQSAFGSNLGRFTAFNDLYHKGTNSKHATGNAFDFTIADAKKSGEAVKQLEDIAKRYGYVVKVLDEYRNPSSRATGGHIHVSVLGFKGTAQMQKDAQAELDIIGKTNEDALKIQADRAKNQLAISLKLGGDLNRIESENQESIDEIKKAFVEGDPNRQKYLDLQKLVYQKDLKEFEKTQEAKRIAAYNTINDPINSMRDKGVEAIAQSSLSPLAYQKWDLNRQQQDGYSQLGDDLSAASMAINDSDVLSEQEKKDKLLQIEQEYQDAKLALAQTYDQQHRDLENQTQAASLAGYGAMFGMMGSMFDAYGDKESTGYKVAFAMQKAFVLSSAILNAKGAVMAAWNDPSNTTIWQKMAAAAATVVQTNDLMSAIQGVALTGMAHDGIANIPEEGTWLLNKGERVLNPQDNKAFTNMINNGGGGGDITIQVNVTDSGMSTAGGNTQDQRQLAQVIGNTVRAVIRQEKRQGGLLSK
ncbi:phage tail tape measure protein [Acinetobacter bereziniae]|uniref:hypothetical protein n=1 Tax=Acinetobacter bereziniae TaxID=106648 RepID=UPI002954D33B|nr:hypothetical protein [Acinetobacter bereziniae]MDV8155192.1 hypothetical protein [Acinetobacter bereziniae]